MISSTALWSASDFSGLTRTSTAPSLTAAIASGMRSCVRMITSGSPSPVSRRLRSTSRPPSRGIGRSKMMRLAQNCAEPLLVATAVRGFENKKAGRLECLAERRRTFPTGAQRGLHVHAA